MKFLSDNYTVIMENNGLFLRKYTLKYLHVKGA